MADEAGARRPRRAVRARQTFADYQAEPPPQWGSAKDRDGVAAGERNGPPPGERGGPQEEGRGPADAAAAPAASVTPAARDGAPVAGAAHGGLIHKGARLRKYFPAHGYFTGTIERMDDELVFVRYEDDDTEELDIAEALRYIRAFARSEAAKSNSKRRAKARRAAPKDLPLGTAPKAAPPPPSPQASDSDGLSDLSSVASSSDGEAPAAAASSSSEAPATAAAPRPAAGDARLGSLRRAFRRWRRRQRGDCAIRSRRPPSLGLGFGELPELPELYAPVWPEELDAVLAAPPPEGGFDDLGALCAPAEAAPLSEALGISPGGDLSPPPDPRIGALERAVRRQGEELQRQKQQLEELLHLRDLAAGLRGLRGAARRSPGAGRVTPDALSERSDAPLRCSSSSSSSSGSSSGSSGILASAAAAAAAVSPCDGARGGDVDVGLLAPPGDCASIRPRDRVYARWKGQETFYAGTVVRATSEGYFEVRYDDGDVERRVYWQLIWKRRRVLPPMVEEPPAAKAVGAKRPHEGGGGDGRPRKLSAEGQGLRGRGAGGARPATW